MWKSLILMTVVVSLTITSQTLLKKGLKETREIKIYDLQNFYSTIFNLAQNKFIITGVLIAIIGALFWLTVISQMDLSVAFPIMGGIFFVMLFLTSWIFLGESITVAKILGVLLIIAGIYTVFK